MKRIPTALMVLVLAGAGTAQAEIVPLDMNYIDFIGLTTVWGGQYSGSVSTVRITDFKTGGGDPGVFTGMDVDFVWLDRDGDFNTFEDRILPILSSESTSYTPGAVRMPAGVYTPSANRPGPLFGSNAAGQLDNAIATLASHDAGYPLLKTPTTVQNSHGWVSLGNGGVLELSFEAPEDNYWIFVGEAGYRNETVGAGAGTFASEVEVTFLGGETMEVVLEEIEPYNRASINGYDLVSNPSSSSILGFGWRTGDQQQYTTDPFQMFIESFSDEDFLPSAPPTPGVLNLDYQQMLDWMEANYPGFDPSDGGTVEIFMKVYLSGQPDLEPGVPIARVTLAAPIPEPASMGLLALGSLALLRRRR